MFDILIQSAAAQDAAAGAPQGGGFLSLLPLIILFVVFYFLIIRPQTKRVKEHKQMVEALGKGDEVVTNGGLLGKVTELGDNFIVMEIADNVTVKVQRMSIATVMPKGTYKSDEL